MGETPLYQLKLRPNRSLGRIGQRRTLIIMAIPLVLLSLALLGHGTWFLVPLALSPLLAILLALRRNNRDGRLHEILTIWKGHFELLRIEADGAVRSVRDETYFLDIIMLKNKGPVENYLILKTPKHQCELGAFLSPEERATIYDELRKILSQAR